MPEASFPDLPSLARHLRTELQTRKSVLIYAYIRYTNRAR